MAEAIDRRASSIDSAVGLGVGSALERIDRFRQQRLLRDVELAHLEATADRAHAERRVREEVCVAGSAGCAGDVEELGFGFVRRDRIVTAARAWRSRSDGSPAAEQASSARSNHVAASAYIEAA